MKSYYTFVASLPALPRQFDEGQHPISASSLRHRLTILDDDDRQVTEQLSDFFRWDRQPIERTDDEVLRTHQRLQNEITNSLVRRLIQHRFEMRVVVAAVRCQRSGLSQPRLPELPISSWIRRHWDQPLFRLSLRYQWLNSFCQALDQDEPQLAQGYLFSELWTSWTRLSERYHFSFESIVLYLARWELVYRWASQNAERGKQRFSDLVDDILSKKPQIAT